MDLIVAIIIIIVALIGGVVAGFVLANSKLNKSAVIQKETL